MRFATSPRQAWETVARCTGPVCGARVCERPIPARPALASLLEHFVEAHGMSRETAEKIFSRIMKRTVPVRRLWPAGYTAEQIKQALSHAASVYAREGMDGIARMADRGMAYMRRCGVKFDYANVRLEPDQYVLYLLLRDNSIFLRAVIVAAMIELGMLEECD